MPQRLLIFWTVWATIFTVFGVVGLGRAMLAYHNDYYWTSMTRQESLQRNGRFEVYVGGKLLDRRLQEGELALRSGGSWVPLRETDVSIRLNHIDEVTRTPLLYGIGFTAAGLAWLSALLGIRRAQRLE